MARFHGKDARFYANGTDLSSFVGGVTISRKAAAHESTTFASDGNMEFDSGVRTTDVNFEGFHDAAASAEDAVLSALVGSGGIVLSLVLDDADALGDHGVLIGGATLETYETAANVGDLTKKTGTFRGGGSGSAVLLHVLGQETVTGNAASVDNAASSANGARANLHITAITGTWTIIVQHSADDSAWSDLITFSTNTAAGGVTGTATGTVNRYLRVRFVEDVAGSITFALTAARG